MMCVQCIGKLKPVFQLSLYFRANCRFIYTEKRLHIDKYRAWRLVWASQRISRVRSMEEAVKNEDTQISTKHMRDFLAVVEEEDVDLLDAVVRKFNKGRGGETDTQETTVMMAFYCLNQADKALEMLRDTELSDYFKQVTCQAVAMQLLYNNARFRDIIDLYKSYQNIDRGFSSICTTLVLASCYLLNSRESLQIAVSILDRVIESGRNPISRQVALAGGLALRQGRYRLAAHICGPEANLTTNVDVIGRGCAVRSIQIISLARSGNISQAMNVLSHYVLRCGTAKPPRLCRESVDELVEIVCKHGSMEDKEEVSSFYEKLESEGRLDPLNLHDILLIPIDLRLNVSTLDAMSTWRERLMGRRAVHYH